MSKYVYKKRTFLNDDPTLPAFIIATVKKLETGKNRKNQVYPELTTTFTLSDCSRHIDLDFSFWTNQDMKSVKKKIQLFRQIINEFADAVEKEISDYENGSITEKDNSKARREA